MANKLFSLISNNFGHDLDNNYAECIVDIIKKIINPDNPLTPGVFCRVMYEGFELDDLDNITKASMFMKETGLPIDY